MRRRFSAVFTDSDKTLVIMRFAPIIKSFRLTILHMLETLIHPPNIVQSVHYVG
jgi:hypothetical protein